MVSAFNDSKVAFHAPPHVLVSGRLAATASADASIKVSGKCTVYVLIIEGLRSENQSGLTPQN